MATATETRFKSPSSPSERQPIRVSGYCRWKGVLDRLAAMIMLVPGLPVIGLLVMITRLSSPGPGIFRQRRVGKDGRVFTMYKIRSMRSDAESKTGAVWCVSNDPRITPLGYWLRKLHLDEFPQLLNVLKGEMSLVGPRPERPEFVEVLAKQIPGYNDRLAVAPGITGLAQVNLPPDTDLDSVRRKLLLDREYISNASLLFDLRMMFATFLRLLGLGGGLSLSVMKLHRTVDLPPRDEDAADEEENPFAPSRGERQTPSAAKTQSIRDTVTEDLGDTIEFTKFIVPESTSDSEDGDDSAETNKDLDEGFVSPDLIAARVSKTKPR